MLFADPELALWLPARLALLSVDGITKYLSVEKLEVVNRVLALLLAALAMETILNGLGDALGYVIQRLQETGVLGK